LNETKHYDGTLPCAAEGLNARKLDFFSEKIAFLDSQWGWLED
jgi:hypothetical protein